jgi:phage gpG-like protein
MQTPASDYFKKLAASLPELKRKLLDVVEVEAENHNMRNFENEGFYGNSFQPWKERKDKTNDRKILIHTGDLKKAATTAQRSSGGIAFVMNQPYARVHNEGLKAGRGKGFTMPQRQFIGESRILDDLIRRKFGTVINRHIKSL